eukprot:CAMPEP_0184704106 /NCGR_PEP_ID=MMETSP0313-20130426/30141_1 /TAXON_ID=2792 /ORGANISM="Porphyridium aerugineum, Strain SAG 1380-2" /LENGTH=348 /DNA_ID=CAMNT_0027165071 /DNA_START=326 /DNA_END=1372 /DNA_ORIENTATION=+
MWEIQPTEHLYLEALCFVLDGLGFHCCWIDRDQTVRCVRFHEASRFAPNIVCTRMSILECSVLDEIIRIAIQISLIFKNELASLLLSQEEGNIHIYRLPVLNASRGQTYPANLLDGSTTHQRKKRRQDDLGRSRPTANRRTASDNLISHLDSPPGLNQPASAGLEAGMSSSIHASLSSSSLAIAPTNITSHSAQMSSFGQVSYEGEGSEDVIFTCESGPEFQRIMSASDALRIQHDTINRIRQFHNMWRSAPPQPDDHHNPGPSVTNRPDMRIMPYDPHTDTDTHSQLPNLPNPGNPGNPGNPENPDSHRYVPNTDADVATNVDHFLREFVSKQERYLYSLYHSIHGP